MKTHRFRSGRAKWIAIAAGTKGQRILTTKDRWLDDRKHILRKCHGWTPHLPLSPSGCMPFVILCPLWLKPGMCAWCWGFSCWPCADSGRPTTPSDTPVSGLDSDLPRNLLNISRSVFSLRLANSCGTSIGKCFISGETSWRRR